MEAGPREQPDFNCQQCEMLPAPEMAITNLPILRQRLLAWYATHRRDLPWRRSADPYRIWLSEIMLQQTRVAAVLEHYRAFLERFPTVEQLAAAPLSSVLAAWSGLGYYRRARALHRAARQIVERHGSRFPRTLPELRALPGVGRYTSAALASIAFGVPAAAVDGNVERVFSRLWARPSHAGEPCPPQSPNRLDCWALAEALLDRRRPGDWNQALMELGATVCLPRQPQCGRCPLKRWCATNPEAKPAPAHPGLAADRRQPPADHPERAERAERRRGSRQRLLPASLGLGGRAITAKARQKCQESYLFALRRGSVYLVRRAARASLMPGMWELPRLAQVQPSSEPPLARPLFKLKHSITVTDYEITIFSADEPGEGQSDSPSIPDSCLVRSDSAGPASALSGGRWVRLKRLTELPLTGLTRKVLRRAHLIE
jgi:A/G-specific adenine glycosylase